MFGRRNVLASSLSGCKMSMFTDYRLQKDGFTRILVRSHRPADSMNRRTSRWQAGRAVKHIIDMECYRLLALLSLPLAVSVRKPMLRLDTQMQDVMKKLNNPGSKEAEHVGARRLLEEMVSLNSQAEQISARIKPRFAAATAYFGVYQDRAQYMEMKDYGQFTCCDKFIMQRLRPAMQTLASTATRLDLNMESLQRASNLLRTRVEITQEQQNAEVLESMAKRAEMQACTSKPNLCRPMLQCVPSWGCASLQLKLQETVEGLSVGPVTYYTLGVLAYGLKGLHGAGVLPCSVEMATGLAMPVVLVAVWLGLRRLHKHLHSQGNSSTS